MSFPLRFGPCWLDSVLASGQSGLLFRAHPGPDEAWPASHAQVAKVPYLYLQRSSGFRQMFLERMAALSGLDHAGLIPVEASGRAGNLVWLTMPRVEGLDGEQVLSALQSGGPRPSPRQILSLGLRLADALGALHQSTADGEPLVHGELRPSKLLFLPDGEPRLIVASAVTAAAGERSSASSADRFAWRAPEQLLRQPESTLTDVRGLALILFVLLTGSNPFQRRTTARTCSAILQDQVLFEGDAQLSQELSALLRAAMSSSPERRPTSMEALSRGLESELQRLGGAEAWQPWLVQLWATASAREDDGRSSSEREALISRLVRDAPRVPEEVLRAEHAPPAPVAPEPPPAPAPPEPPLFEEPAFEPGTDAEPTVLFGAEPRPPSESSGFTLVPDDIGHESPSTVRIEQLGRRALPPEDEDLMTAESPPDPTEEWLPEPTSEWTHETSYEVTAERTSERTSERTEDLPAPERRARRQAKMFGAGAEVDSSFVLVTDEPTASAGVIVSKEAVGQKEALPERLSWPPPLNPPPPPDEEDGDFIPALSEEECLAELALEQANREEDEEDPDDLPTPLEDSVPIPVSPTVTAVVQVAPSAATPARAEAKVTAEPAKARPITTLPTVVNQPSPTVPPPPRETTPPRPATPPPPVAAPTASKAPVTAASPSPSPSREAKAPPPTTRPGPATTSTATAAPVKVQKPKAPTQPSSGGNAGTYIGVALFALLLIIVAVRFAGKDTGAVEDPARQTSSAAGEPLRPDPARPDGTPPDGVPVVGVDPVQTTPTPPDGSTTGPNGTASGTPTGETPPATPTPVAAGGDGVTSAEAQPTTRNRPRQTEEPTAGPPGLISLKAESGTETSINIRGTMRGDFGRPSASRVPGAGTNGGDQYVLTFQGTENQLRLTRVNVTSPLVSSVEIMSAPGTLTLLVNVSAGCTVSYDAVPGATSFRIRVSRPAGG